MKEAMLSSSEPVEILEQPNYVEHLNGKDRELLIVSMRKVSGTWVIVSRYGDNVWWLTGTTTNRVKCENKLDFMAIPHEFRDVSKVIMYRLMRRGLAGKKRPTTSSLIRTMTNVRLFLKYLKNLGISSLKKVSALACMNYVEKCKARSGSPLAPSTLTNRFAAVAALYELSQYTDTPIPEHPWPDSSSTQLSGDKKGGGDSQKKTPLIPDDVFTTLFQKAWQILEDAEKLLDLRDEIDRIGTQSVGLNRATVKFRKNKRLRELGFKGGLVQLHRSLLEIRTAAYVVIASVSGCRNHELAFLRINAYYSTEDDEGERYWWMRSISKKTHEGDTEWMIPEAAVDALKIMERWAAPFQTILRREIECLRLKNPLSPGISEAEEHLDALFIGKDNAKGNTIRTLSVTYWNVQLNKFSKLCGLNWKLTSHQFRRKFANYAARSQFGDLRYLKQHFKHWSMNMTLGYALNESQEMALYLEIEDEIDEFKETVVTGWLNSSTPLAGGYGQSIIEWRSRDDNIVLFKNHSHMVKSIAHSTALRSNGHAWCTADDDLCIGNTLEPTRCGGGCNNAVIGTQHAIFYQGLYSHLSSLLDADDIGKGGKARIERDLQRCSNVLSSLEYTHQGAST